VAFCFVLAGNFQDEVCSSLSVALRSAQTRHAYLRSRVVRGSHKLKLFDSVSTPVSYLGHVEDKNLLCIGAQHVETEMNTYFDTDEDGNLILLKGAVLLSDSRCFVILVMHHLICDGISGMALCGEMATAMLMLQANAKRDIPSLVEDLQDQKLPANLSDIIRRNFSWPSRVYLGVKTLIKEILLPRPFVAFPIDRQLQHTNPSTSLIIRDFDCNHLRDFCKRHGTTVGAALDACVLVAAYLECRACCGHRDPLVLLLRSSFNVRPYFQVPQSQLGYFASNLQYYHVFANPTIDGSFLLNLACIQRKSTVEQLKAAPATIAGWVSVKEWLSSLIVKKMHEGMLQPPATCLVTNIGDQTTAAFSNCAASVLQSFFCSTANAWNTIEVSAVTHTSTVNSVMTLGFVFPRALVSSTTALRFTSNTTKFLELIQCVD